MKSPLKEFFVITVCFVLVIPLLATTVKKKDGQIIDGKINGLVVIKGPKESSGKNKFGFAYILINGKEIDTIDEEGAHIKADVKILSLGTSAKKKEKLPKDIEVLESVLHKNIIKNDFYSKLWMMGVKVFRILPKGEGLEMTGGDSTIGPANISKNIMFLYIGKSNSDRKIGNKNSKILGEFRIENEKGVIIPALNIATSNGGFSIPVEDIIDFKEERISNLK